MRIDKRKGLISGFGFCENVLRGRESLWSLGMGRGVIVFNKTCTHATFSISIQIDKLKLKAILKVNKYWTIILY